jgi:hypothetical protein
MSVAGGTMAHELFLPHSRTRLTLRCDALGGVFASHTTARRVQRSR